MELVTKAVLFLCLVEISGQNNDSVIITNATTIRLIPTTTKRHTHRHSTLTTTTTVAQTTTQVYFSDMPDNLQVFTVDPTSQIEYDNKGERTMGKSDVRCDDAKIQLETDFDPKNLTDLELKTKCFENQYNSSNKIDPVLTMYNVPKRYVPIHKCMHIKLNYMERIPTIGPHRPLWARYGEYVYLPVQRWLHNVEHGAIIGLYHPCADSEQVNQLRNILTSCLFRHVLTPYLNLTAERPIALVGWSAALEMSQFDFNLSKNFIKFYARTGPERVFRDGQYKHLLVKKAKYVTNVIDSEVCPNM